MTAPLSETGIIGPITTLATAPLIGFGFGWCLERSGLGRARTLAGQFFLVDLTVFKVMFSALLTAMLGAFWLDQLGWLDLQLVYLPETFVVPQALGGALFGAGFVAAGLCPGTSCVAAATGRLDGVAVLGGMILGIVFFNLEFDRLAAFYHSTPLGAVTWTDLLGVPYGAGVAVTTVAALGGFRIAASLECRRQ